MVHHPALQNIIKQSASTVMRKGNGGGQIAKTACHAKVNFASCSNRHVPLLIFRPPEGVNCSVLPCYENTSSRKGM
jgi:hypothetical protein